jgi:hypothetical protein
MNAFVEVYGTDSFFSFHYRLPRVPLRQAADTRLGEDIHLISPLATQVTMSPKLSGICTTMTTIAMIRGVSVI